MNDPALPPSFWAAPGGGVEAEETLQGAAERELWEELELRIPIRGPVHTLTSTWVERDVQVYSEDTYFVGRCGTEEPMLGGVNDSERHVLREARWWNLAELEQTSERVFPAGLPALLRTLL